MLKVGGNMGGSSSAFTEFLHPLMAPLQLFLIDRSFGALKLKTYS